MADFITILCVIFALIFFGMGCFFDVPGGILFAAVMLMLFANFIALRRIGDILEARFKRQ